MSSQVKPLRVLSTQRAHTLRLELVKTEASIRCGERIRQAREAKALTQSALARKLPGKTDGPSVSRWERGIVMPGTANLEALSEVLGVDYAYFMMPPEPKPTPDLMAALPNGNAQLNRIEEMLSELRERVSALQDDNVKLRGQLGSALMRRGAKQPDATDPAQDEDRPAADHPQEPPAASG